MSALVVALRVELERQFLAAHADHCRPEWPHDGDCYWPAPYPLVDRRKKPRGPSRFR